MALDVQRGTSRLRQFRSLLPDQAPVRQQLERRVQGLLAGGRMTKVLRTCSLIGNAAKLANSSVVRRASLDLRRGLGENAAHACETVTALVPVTAGVCHFATAPVDKL